MSTTTATTPTLTIPDPPYKHGDVVYSRHNAQPYIVTEIAYRSMRPWSFRADGWYWHIAIVPAARPDSRPAYDVFDVDDISREPWPVEVAS